MLEAAARPAGTGRLPGHLSRCTPKLPISAPIWWWSEYVEEPVGRLASSLPKRWFNAASTDTRLRPGRRLVPLKDLDGDIRLGPSTGAIVQAAVARGIPTAAWTGAARSSSAGAVRQRRIQAGKAKPTLSSAIAESIAQDKELTKQLLHAAGVAVPPGRPVKDAEDAWAAAQENRRCRRHQAAGRQSGQGRITVNITGREGK